MSSAWTTPRKIQLAIWDTFSASVIFWIVLYCVFACIMMGKNTGVKAPEKLLKYWLWKAFKIVFCKTVSYRKRIASAFAVDRVKIFLTPNLDNHSTCGCCLSYCVRTCGRSWNWGRAVAPPLWDVGRGWPNSKHGPTPHLLSY